MKLFKKLMTDQKLLVLYKWTLGVGNYLNGQSNKGGAYGFKIDAIEKMSDIKTQDNKSNLLIYVMEKVEDEINA